MRGIMLPDPQAMFIGARVDCDDIVDHSCKLCCKL